MQSDRIEPNFQGWCWASLSQDLKTWPNNKINQLFIYIYVCPKSQGRSEAQGQLTFLFFSLSSYVFLTFFHFLISFPSCFFFLYSPFLLRSFLLSLSFFSSPFSPHSLPISPSLPLHAPPDVSPHPSPAALPPSGSASRLGGEAERGPQPREHLLVFFFSQVFRSVLEGLLPFP